MALLVLSDAMFLGSEKELQTWRTAAHFRRCTVKENLSTSVVSYGPSLVDMSRRGAGHVDKILRGAKPKDIPVEQPTKFDLVINLKTAKHVGLPIPQSLLARADEVKH